MRSDAKAVKYTGKGFKVYLNLAPLTGRSLKWYIYCIQMQVNFENLISPTFQTPAVGKTLKPYQGLKLYRICQMLEQSSRKNPKTLSGIETWELLFLPEWWTRRKNPKTLSGIETIKISVTFLPSSVGKTLKPYQGLKPLITSFKSWNACVGKTLKPYQGLKPCWFFHHVSWTNVGKTLKPYQGLKRAKSFGLDLSSC